MVNMRRKNQAVKGTSGRGGDMPGEQPSANGSSPRQYEEVRVADLAIAEQRIVTIEDNMNDLEEMI